VTAQAQTRFVCDRCAGEEDVNTQNTTPAQRVSGPKGWLTLWLHEPTRPATHLCPVCAPAFDNFFKEN
jgi:hypothetical protein